MSSAADARSAAVRWSERLDAEVITLEPRAFVSFATTLLQQQNRT
jgi:hypothetical protein